MIVFSDNISIKDLAEMQRLNPEIPQYARLQLCKSYEDFIDLVHDEIDVVFNEFQENANILQDHGENAFNFAICQNLRRIGFSAQHDPNHRGHTDILVKYGKFSYVGEGKIVTSVNNYYLNSGYEQLTTRYATGTTNNWACGLLIYCFAPDAKHVIDTWKAHLTTLNESKLDYAHTLKECSKSPDFAFFTHNKHVSSGGTLSIRHQICSLHWPHKKKLEDTDSTIPQDT